MKKVLSAVLALLLLVTGFVFPTAAETAAKAAQTGAVEGFDILVTDSETLKGWQSFEGEGLPAKQLVAMSGHGNVMSLTHSGTMYAGGGWANPNGNGTKPTNGVKLAYLASTPYDISDMNYFVFDVYVSHPDKISNKNFFVELSSAGKNDKEENSIEATLAAMKGEPIHVGWNRIYLDLDSIPKGTGSDTGKPAMNEKKWNFFRIYNQTGFDAGEELVLAFDNVGFALQKPTADLEEHKVTFRTYAAEETPYYVSGGSKDGTSRYADKTAQIVYCYPLEQLARAERILWTAGVANQFHLEVSVDGVNYETVYAYNTNLDSLINSGNNSGNSALAGWQMLGLGAANYTFNLTETVKSLANETSDKLYIRVGDSYPYAIVKTENGDGTFTYTEDKAGTSGFHAGSGGKLMGNADITLSVSYPWGVIMPSVSESVSFTVNTPDEKAYIYGSAASYSTGSKVRFADKQAYFCYAYPVKNIQTADSIRWTAQTAGQLLLDVSTDFQSWTEIYRFTAPVATMVANPNTAKSSTYDTYDITDAILKTATADTEYVYIRVRDAYPFVLNADGTPSATANGTGGNVAIARPVVFAVDYEVDAAVRTETRAESVHYRFMPVTATEKKGVTHNALGTITTGSEYPYLYLDHYKADNSDKARLYSNNRYYYGDKLQHLLYAFPVEKGATLTSVVFSAMMGAELSVSVSDSPNGPWYEGEVRTAEEIASGVAKDAVLKDQRRTVDLSAAAALLGEIRGDKVYVRIGDSDTSDGVGGRTWEDLPAEFTCSYTVTDTITAQTSIGRGAWHTFTPTTASASTGSNHTNIGTVTDSSEYPYLVLDQYAADGSDRAQLYSNGSFYFTDRLRYLMYAFPIEDGAVLESAYFEATMGIEISVAVSDSPAGPWRELEVRTPAEIAEGKAATDQLTKMLRKVDLSAAVRQIGTFEGDMIYVRLGDSVLTTGSGCQINNSAATFACTYFVQHDKKNADSALKFKSGALSLTNDFGISYAVNVPADYTDVELRAAYADEGLRVETLKRVGDELTFDFVNIPAHCLSDEILTTLIATKDGGSAVVHKRYSVRQYCENMLSKSNDATFRTLLSDVLAYGAAAQRYAGYRTDDLATNVNATLTPSVFDINLVKGERGVSGTKSDLADWYSASLTLDTAMTLNMTFTATNVDDVAINVQIGDRPEETLTEFVPLGGGRYRASYEIMAYEFDETLTAGFVVGGVRTGRTLTYSVGGYIKSTYANANGALKALLESIANYGYSVDAYVAENPSLMGATRNEDNVIYPAKTAYVSAAEYSRAIALNDSGTNLTLLQSVMNRAKAGEAVTVATIGGSITQGSSSSNNETKSYSALFRDWWKTTFPSATVTHVNAGIGATTSYLGVHRVADHVIAKNPDVCIVEFSVNDYHEDLYGETYESLVAKLLDEGIAVMLVFTVKESGDSMQAVHAAIGAKYRLPMLSYGDAIFPTITAGQRTWADISPDNIHPNDYGHAYIGEMLWKYLNSVYAYAPDTVTPVGYDSAALKATPFYNAELLGPVATSDTTHLTPETLGAFAVNGDVSYSRFDDAWVYDPASTAQVKEMTFSATFSRLGAMYLRTVDGLSGTCEVLVDGKLVAVLDGNFAGGWGNYTNTAEFYRADEAALHTVTIRMTDATKSFTLCRLLATDYEASAQ